jgi:hypothetical protein
MLTENIEEQFGTFAVDKVTRVHSVPSVKWTGCTLTAKPGVPVELQFKGIGTDELTNSTVNTTLASVTTVDASNRMQLKDAVIMVNNESAATLSGTDAVSVTSLSLEFDRPHTNDYENTGSNHISEPLGDGYPNGKVSLEFRKYGEGEAQYYSDWVTGTTKKMEVVFSGSTIENDHKYEFRVLFPRLKIKEVKTSGSNNIVTSVSMDCEAPASAPAGMTGLTRPFKIRVKNMQSSKLI